MRLLKIIFLVLLFVGMGSPAYSGGPVNVDDVNNSGVPRRWPNNTVEWYVDGGNLSSGVKNATAIQWIQDLFDKWSNVTLTDATGKTVKTTTAKALYKGIVTGSDGKNLDITYKEFTDTYQYGVPVTIIFDEGGDIIATLHGEKNRSLELGLTAAAGPTTNDDGTTLARGVMVLNGYLLSKNIVSEDRFKAAVLHELGHLLNLDHSQVNMTIAENCSDTSCTDGNYIPTMYPISKTESQLELARDDIIALSWLYPSDDFKKSFCTITGEVFDSKGLTLKGINVFAYRVNEGDSISKIDVRSFVSGATTSLCVGKGTYYLSGVVPGKQYHVSYEPIGSDFSGSSDLEPLGADSPSGFKSGDILAPSGDSTASCANGGETVEMASATIADAKNSCPSGSDTTTPTTSEAQKTSGPKCGLYPIGGSWEFATVFLIMMIGAIVWRRNCVKLPHR